MNIGPPVARHVRRPAKPGTSLRLLGLKNGDLIKSLNGDELDGLDAAMAAYGKLRSATALELELEREGQTTRLTIEIVDELSDPAADSHPP